MSKIGDFYLEHADKIMLIGFGCACLGMIIAVTHRGAVPLWANIVAGSGFVLYIGGRIGMINARRKRLANRQDRDASR